MFKPRLIVISILLVCVTCIKMNAQQKPIAAVTIADLEQRYHPKDSSASAAIIYKIGDCNISYVEAGFTTEFQVKTRIKIYKKEGYNWANQNILFRSSRAGLFRFSDVVTYNLVDGKIETTKLKNEGAFEEKINKYISQKKITLPNIKEGSIIEFTYTSKGNGASSPPNWNFQEAIPVDYSELKTHIPEYLRCNTNQKGYLFPKVSVVKKQRMNYEETLTTYIAENFPAMKSEAFVTNINNYRAGISHEFSGYNLPGRSMTNFGKLASDWPNIAKVIHEEESFGKELLKKGYFEQDVDSVIKGITTQRAMVEAVFNHVKNTVKWNRSGGFMCDMGVKNAYKTKTGNVAEINLMLIAMLRYLQIQTDPVLISTQDNGLILFPSLEGFDYVICAVQLPNELILLDATERFSGMNLLPSRDLNWYGRLIRDNGSNEQIDLLPTIISQEIHQVSATLADNGLIEGKVRRQLTNYSALEFREKNNNESEELYLESLEKKHNNIQIEDYKRGIDKNNNLPVTETFSFTDSKAVEIINDKIYLSPLLFLTAKSNPFLLETRQYPIDFKFPLHKKTTISIIIPDGYEIESAPSNINIESGESVSSFSYLLGKSENVLQLTINENSDQAVVSASFYDVIKDFYQQLTDKQNEKIVLVKKI